MLTKKLLTEINTRPQKRRALWQFVALGAGVIFLAAYLLFTYTLALAILLAGTVCVWLVYRRDRAGKTTSLVYDDLETETAARFAATQEACEAVAASERIWRTTEQPDRSRKSDVDPVSDRHRVEVGQLEPPGISTNVDIWGIGTDALKVLFFPEAILLYQQERYRAISYESLNVSLSSTRLVEEEEVPEDAEVVGHTWRYTMADGKPDRRYKPNPRLPLVLYGLLRLAGPSGLDMSLQVSSRAAAARFARAFGAAEEHKGAREEPPRKEHPRKEAPGSSEQEKTCPPAEAAVNGAAYSILGLKYGASEHEIAAAYKKLARVYHPDKVASLSPEVRQYADNKMKEINAAYAQLKHKRA